MSQEFQLQLIRKTLDELGHSPVADLLSERMAASLWQPRSRANSLMLSLQHSVSSGDYNAATAVLNGRSDEFDFHGAVSGAASMLSPQQRHVAEYLVLRFQFLEMVLRRLLQEAPVPTERDLVGFLQTDLAAVFNRIDKSDTSVLLVLRIPRDHEGALLLPLAMTPPLLDQIDAAIFSPELLLTTPAPRPLGTPADYRWYLQRLRDALCYLLRVVLATSETSDASLSLSYHDIPSNCLADIIRGASQYNLFRYLYYLPPRVESSDTENALGSIIVPGHMKNSTREDLPIHLLHTLSGHTDEVWFTRFSPLGRYLATGSLDGTCIIYDVVNSFKVVAELDSNEEDEDAVFVEGTHKPGLDKKKGIISLCWEPHERYIVTCCLDTVIRVWHVESVTLNKRITRSMDDGNSATLVTCFTLGERMRTWPCEFLHYEKSMTPHFIVGSPDKVLKVFSIEGQEILDFYSDADEWLTLLDDLGKPVGADALANIEPSSSEHKTDASGNGNGENTSASQFNRINDFAITPNGKVLITANNDKQVFFYRIPNLFDPSATTFRIALLSLNGRLTSCSVSANGKYMLISIAPEEIQVWDISPLDNYEMPFLKQKFLGQSQALYMVRSCFGYLTTSTNEEELVLSGSDDGFAYIWKLQTGQLVTRVRAHRGLCNSVDWNRMYKPPKLGKDYGAYWCSVGDDKLVKIWGPRS